MFFWLNLAASHAFVCVFAQIIDVIHPGRAVPSKEDIRAELSKVWQLLVWFSHMMTHNAADVQGRHPEHCSVQLQNWLW